MIKLIKTSGIYIPREYEDKEFYQLIKRELTIHVREYQKSTFITNRYYIENEKYLKVPRYFPIQNYIKNFEIINKLNPGKDININHNIVFRDELQKNIVNYMLNNNNGIIKANPGSGKTVVTIYVVATLKKKAFIISHRTNLTKQWVGPGIDDEKQGFLDFTDISKDEIGILSSKNFKDVLQKSIIVSTDQSFIAILKKYRDEFLKELYDANIGIFIGDEVHTSVGAPTYAECSLSIPSPITFGLSATPKRIDGAFEIMKYHLGEIVDPEGKSSTMDSRVTFLLFDFGFLPKSRYYLFGGGFFQKSRYFKILKNSKILMEISKTLINKFLSEGRKILFMGDRIKFLEILYKDCKHENKGIFIAGSDVKEISKDITFSTPNKSRDGINYIEKDCLIMSAPIGNIDQMSGRVCRIKKGKKTPIILDLVDVGIKDISNTFINRNDFYKSKGWEIQYIFINKDKKMIKISEDQVIKMINGEE